MRAAGECYADYNMLGDDGTRRRLLQRKCQRGAGSLIPLHDVVDVTRILIRLSNRSFVSEITLPAILDERFQEARERRFRGNVLLWHLTLTPESTMSLIMGGRYLIKEAHIERS